ncbi:MAG: SDR family NAD(P)-dependent oxidoreductase [Pseudomonadota bacterium]
MNRKKFAKRFGPWVVLTGASAGIGEEFAHQLARTGVNLVLVARSGDKLDRLAADLASQHSIETRTLILDLSQPEAWEAVDLGTRDLDVGALISNAGADHMGAFLKVPLADLDQMFRLNAQSHLHLAHRFGTRFFERGGGGILLVGSTASLQGTPYVGNYSGAKAYLLNLGQAINHEMRRTGVQCCVVLPGPTDTAAFNDRPDVDFKKAPLPPMKTKPVVRAGLAGLLANKPFVIPGAMNATMAWMGRTIMGRNASSAMWGSITKPITREDLKFG